MKQILLKSWLTMLCLLVGVGTSWGEDLVVTYDFTNASNYPSGFSTSNKNTCDTETGYTFGGNTIYFKTANSGNLYQAKYSEEYSVFLGKNVKYSATDANSIASTAYMKIPGKTGYKITKLVVTNAANAATKDINLAVCNSSYQMVISSGVASSTSNAMTFNINSTGTTLAENEAAYFCVAPTVASGKNLNVRKIVVTYTPCEASVKYNVNIANDVLNGTVESNVTSASEGATVTLKAIPSVGYKFDSWDVENASTNTTITVTNNQFTMPAADVNVSASFSETQKYTITWSVNGNNSTIAPTQVEDGANITFPTGLDDINGKKFVGWSANKDASAATDLVSGDVAASADVTFYAVFADVTAGSQTTATLSLNETEDVSYTDGLTRTDDKGNDWVSYACVTNQKVNNVVHRYLQIAKSSNGYYIGSPDFGSNIKAISAKVWNTSSSNREAYLKANTKTKQPSVSDYGTTSIPASSKGVEIDLNINDKAEFSQFYIYGSGAIGFEWIEVTYGEADVVSGYCTTVTAPIPTYTYDEFVAKRESLTENDIFNVTLEDITIVGTYDATGAGGYMVTISKDGYLQIPIYAPAPTPAKEWTVGGTLSGTLTNVIWGGNGTTISSEDVSIWDNLTYKPIQTYTLDQLFGTPSKDYVNVEVDDVVESCMTDVPGTYSVMFKNSGVSLIIHTDNLEWVAGGTVKGTLNNVQWRGDNNTIYGRAYDYWEALTYVPTFASLAELLNADLEDGTVVTVSFDNEIFYLNYDEEEESATVVLNEGDNFVGLMAYGAYDTDWQGGGKLAGTWENVYYAKQLGNVYLMSDSETPWEDVNYTAPAVATISLNAACHDEDGMVYGTYSNSSAWIVPADLIVSEISIIDGQLYVESYDEGDVVPANTGVMVSAEEGGNYQVVIASELMSMFAESVLGEDNCLRPSGDAGISANAMAEAAPNSIYYRLTMQHGTQIGYWWGAADGAAFSLAANKAYLAVPKEAAAKMNGLWLDDEATLIDAICNSKKENGAMYNLNGQRVNTNAKGIVIVNGKKMLNK